MLNDIQYQPSEKNIIAVERAITEIRRGGIVVLTHHDLAALVMSVEVMAASDLARFATLGGELLLVLSAKRANHIFAPQHFTQHSTLQATGKTLEELQQIGGIDASQPCSFRYDDYHLATADSLANAAITLTKAAELMPSAVIAYVAQGKEAALQWAQRNGVLTLDNTTLDAYRENTARALNRACDAPLCLHHAEHSHIIAFRPASGGKEHYALMIGTPGHEEPPLVRIHSSCYTGDLLGSLRCDCGDQLHAAIEFMGSNPQGGIIVYLMQEGRGIGLTNKLRSYALQETGIDTVDANELLGFDDDERLFQPAAEILRQLGYGSVKLLTNNFRKAKGLEACGITVTECVPHVMQAHQFNETYLKTKANRLGHRLPK